MKYVPIIAVICLLLSGCSDKKKQEQAKGNNDPIAEIKSLNLASMQIISDTLAKAMISAAGDSTLVCGNAVSNFSAEDLKKILDIKGVKGIKAIRANYPNNYTSIPVRGMPATIIGIDCTGKMCYALSNTVCPPPDGTSCINGVLVDESGNSW